MNRLQSATDTFRELWTYATIALILGATGYAVFENKSWWDGLWWAIVTAGTVGYGDQYPATVGGRIVGIALIVFSVFFVVPLITARMASRLIVNDDAWTHEEQEEIKSDIGFVREYVDRLPPRCGHGGDPAKCR
ncbi:potassium channel family protein [Mycobacterium sp. AZCC_0083]|uniref:potassium channel family protein n=1 Tax=Mycobacterium sp. AZCC_0083 TaxID=2735882 RepID=UPI0016196DE4|nr:potassium channel family protein [Mycobacterium sp. AZCC_0083]MBB5167178.1 voltage-gated potassium channel [Mycobacterium sp. AZCC_0083]